MFKFIYQQNATSLNLPFWQTPVRLWYYVDGFLAHFKQIRGGLHSALNTFMPPTRTYYGCAPSIFFTLLTSQMLRLQIRIAILPSILLKPLLLNTCGTKM